MDELQLFFTAVAAFPPGFQARRQQAPQDVIDIHLHDYCNIGEELPLHHVLHLISTRGEALQDKTC